MALFSRVKVWTTKEILTYSDLNAEFDNIINNMAAVTTVGYSSSVSQMRSQTNPGGVGSESLAASVSGELERIRFAIARIVGKTYWYEAPVKSLNLTSATNRHQFSPNIPPVVGVNPSTAAENGVSSCVEAGIYDSANFIDDMWRSTTNKKFSEYSLQSDPITLSPILGLPMPRYFWLDSGRLNPNSNTFSFWFRNFAPNETLFSNPVLGLRVYLNTNGYIQADLTTQAVTASDVKVVKSVTGATSYSGASAFNHILVRYSAAGVSGDILEVFINGTSIGSVAGPFAVCTGMRAEKFFLMAKDSRTELRSFNNYYTPENGAQLYPWTLTQTGGSHSVSNGILTLNTTSTTTRYFTQANTAIDTAANGVWVEFKLKLAGISSKTTPLLTTTQGSIQGLFDFFFRSVTGTTGTHCSVFPDRIVVTSSSGINSATANNTIDFAHDFSDWTIVTVHHTTTQKNLYINRVLVGRVDNTQADATATSTVGFGKMNVDSPGGTVYIESYRYGTGSPTLLPNNGNIEQISDFVAFPGLITDTATIASLQTASPLSLFGAEPPTRITEEQGYRILSGATSPATIAPGTNTSLLGSQTYLIAISDGKNPITIDASITAMGVSTGVSGQVLFLSWLELTHLSNVAVSGGYSNLSSYPGWNGSGNMAHGGASDSTWIQIIPANCDMPIKHCIRHRAVFPAGMIQLNCFGWVSAATRSVRILATNVNISQG